MGRNKKKITLKEPVRLRERERANGYKALYLDIYYNGQRSYKNLHLHLVPETDVESKTANINTLALANTFKEEALRELTNKIAGIKDNYHKSKRALAEWMAVYAEDLDRRRAESTKEWLDLTVEAVRDYDPKITLAEIDKKYVAGFLDYLANERHKRLPKARKISLSTQFQFIQFIKAALNQAVRENILPRNPLKSITQSTMSVKEHKREYLTVEEVKRLMVAPCSNEEFKSAFLFSCFCGLRITDVMNLRWGNIVKTTTHWQAEIVQEKTDVALYLPLNNNARKWLPEPPKGTESDDRVFPHLTKQYYRILEPWMKAAGIGKHVTFHVARHTFATLCLTAGVDIYTTSQLLGHTTIRHTQRYARIINSKREMAISLLDDAFE